MWLRKRGKTAKGKIILIDDKELYGHTEIAYWRKSYELHEKFLSYAINLIKVENTEANRKKIAKTLLDLNCRYIPLEKEDLQQIQEWCEKKIESEDYGDGFNAEQDLEVCVKAIKKALKEMLVSFVF